jgi:redox-sensing transcriptional repressor
LHEDFARKGFLIVGVFDSDPAKAGERIGALRVQGMRALPAAVARRQANIGVIAVPTHAAQSAADFLIASGIRGLLNLTQSHVVAPRGVPVVDARILASLQELAHAILEERGACP